MSPTDQTTTSATTARPRTTLWAAELKRARIDFVMLSPPLARPGKIRLPANGGQASFQDQRCFANEFRTHPRLRYVGRLTRVAGLPEPYTLLLLCPGERAGLLPQPEMSILALAWNVSPDRIHQ